MSPVPSIRHQTQPTVTSGRRSRRFRRLRYSLRPVVTFGVFVTAILAVSTGSASAQSPDISIEKSTNGNDADAAPGPTLTAGDPVSWTYEVTVTGQSTMFDLVITDSSGVTPRCDINNDGAVEDRNVHPGPLNPGQSFICTANGSAHAEGVFASTARVVASSFDGTTTYEDSDSSYYTTPPAIVILPAVTIETTVNGVDADTTPGPHIQEGSTVTWNYAVTNTGNVALSDLQVTNSAGIAVDCGGGSSIIVGPIAPGATLSCTSVGTAPAAGSGVQQGVGEAVAVAIHPQTGALAGQTNAKDTAAYTPVQLPGTLAFTGPADYLRRLGFLLWGIGATLWLGGFVLTRRQKIVQHPVKADTGHGDVD